MSSVVALVMPAKITNRQACKALRMVSQGYSAERIAEIADIPLSVARDIKRDWDGNERQAPQR